MQNPIFIVGASRSGTTMLAAMLGRHSTLLDIGETHYLGDLCPAGHFSTPVSGADAAHLASCIYARSRKTIWNSNPDPDDITKGKQLFSGNENVSMYNILSAVANDLAQRAAKKRAVEQTPRNIYYADQILSSGADSHVIEIVRDPRAVLHSQRQRWRMRFLGAPNVPLTESVRTLLNYHAITMSLLWRAAVRTGLAQANNDRYLRVRYEDIVEDPEGSLGRICVFLGIAFEPGMLAIPRISSSTAMNTATTKGVTKDSVDQWQRLLPVGDRVICARLIEREGRILGYDVSRESLFQVPVVWHLLRYPFHLLGSVIANPGRMLTQLRGARIASIFR